MQFKCPICMQPMDVDAGMTGKEVQCPACGRYIPKPVQQEPISSSPPSSSQMKTSTVVTKSRPDDPQRVIITDIQMTIPAIMVLMLKWMIAMIPVGMMISGVYFLFISIILGGCAALIMGVK